jgi:hypothetical protein
MQTNYKTDARQDPDRMVTEAFKERPGKPVKLRIQPFIFRSGFGRGGQYRAWPEVTWMVDCDTVQEVFLLRDVLRAFFRALTTHGPSVVLARLRDAA